GGAGAASRHPRPARPAGRDAMSATPGRHIPVMLDAVLSHLKPAAGETIVDGTFGFGGYTRGILATGASVIAIDRDPDAIAGGAPLVAHHPDRLRLVHGRFGD